MTKIYNKKNNIVENKPLFKNSLKSKYNNKKL